MALDESFDHNSIALALQIPNQNPQVCYIYRLDVTIKSVPENVLKKI